jgi:aspartyl-tRNA(Asn)/glutamyl-tRNA(Gln) amidotransferase subunit A
VTGLKPTYGLISRYGVFPRAWSLDTVGITARTAADIALLLGVIAGADTSDPTASTAPVPNYLSDLSRFSRSRIGIVQGPMREFVEPNVGAAITQAEQTLASHGFETVSVHLPDLGDIAGLGDVIMKSEAAAIHRAWMTERPEAYSMPVFSRIEAGFFISAASYNEALAMRSAVLSDFVRTAFAAADILCLPVVPFVAPFFEEIRVKRASEIAARVGQLTRCSRPFNYLGLPALVCPCGVSADGLPIALQLVGKPFAEGRLLAAAHSFQQITAWHEKRPSLASG